MLGRVERRAAKRRGGQQVCRSPKGRARAVVKSNLARPWRAGDFVTGRITCVSAGLAVPLQDLSGDGRGMPWDAVQY